jgi:hypothetical protein
MQDVQGIQANQAVETKTNAFVDNFVAQLATLEAKNPDAALKLLPSLAAVESVSIREELVKKLCKVSGLKMANVNAELNCLLKNIQKEKHAKSVAAWWSELNFEVPVEYSVSANGVVRFGAKNEDTLTTDPVWVQSLVTNLSTDTEEIELAWRKADESLFLILPLNDVFQRNEFLKIAGVQSIPLRPSYVGKLTDYIADFIKANQQYLHLNKKFLSRRPGWVHLPGDRRRFSVYADEVIFKPDSSMLSAEKHLRQKGGLDGWLQLRPFIEKSSMLAFFVAAALSAPILEILGTSGFCVDQYGESSTGKTTTSRLCASMYGKPGGQTGDGLVAPWHATPTYIEEILGFYSHMPIFCMDSQDLKEEAIERVAYMVANGTGKGRGAKDGGVRVRSEWKSVLLSDGEASMYERLSKTGAKARVISIHGAGCAGLESPDIDALNIIIKDNYGVVAPLFINQLQVMEEDLPEKYKQGCKYFSAKSRSQVEKRVSAYFAIITVAANVLSNIPGFEWYESVFMKAIGTAWKIATDEIEEALPSKLALQKVSDWVTTKRMHFVNNSASTAPPAGQCYGRIEQGQYVAVLFSELEKFLISAGITSPRLMLKAWVSSEVLDTYGNGYWKQVRLQGRQVQTICFKWRELFPEDVIEEASPASTKVVSLPVKTSGLSVAKGRVLSVQDVTRDGEQCTLAEIDGYGWFVIDKSATEHLSHIAYGKETTDSVTAHYRMGLNHKTIMYITKEVANG